MGNSVAYNLSVLERRAQGRLNQRRACRALRKGESRLKMPGLFLVVRIRKPGGRGFSIPLMILPLLLLGLVAAAVAQLVRLCMGRRAIPGLGAGLALLARLQVTARGPLVEVAASNGARVEVFLW